MPRPTRSATARKASRCSSSPLRRQSWRRRSLAAAAPQLWLPDHSWSVTCKTPSGYDKPRNHRPSREVQRPFDPHSIKSENVPSPTDPNDEKFEDASSQLSEGLKSCRAVVSGYRALLVGDVSGDEIGEGDEEAVAA